MEAVVAERTEACPAASGSCSSGSASETVHVGFCSEMSHQTVAYKNAASHTDDIFNNKLVKCLSRIEPFCDPIADSSIIDEKHILEELNGRSVESSIDREIEKVRFSKKQLKAFLKESYFSKSSGSSSSPTPPLSTLVSPTSTTASYIEETSPAATAPCSDIESDDATLLTNVVDNGRIGPDSPVCDGAAHDFLLNYDEAATGQLVDSDSSRHHPYATLLSCQLGNSEYSRVDGSDNNFYIQPAITCRNVTDVRPNLSNGAVEVLDDTPEAPHLTPPTPAIVQGGICEKQHNNGRDIATSMSRIKNSSSESCSNRITCPGIHDTIATNGLTRGICETLRATNSEHIDQPGHIEQCEHIDQPGHIEQCDHIDQRDQIEQRDHIDQPGHIEQRDHIDQPGHIEQRDHIDQRDQIEQCDHIDQPGHIEQRDYTYVANVDQHSSVDNMQHDLQTAESLVTTRTCSRDNLSSRHGFVAHKFLPHAHVPERRNKASSLHIDSRVFRGHDDTPQRVACRQLPVTADMSLTCGLATQGQDSCSSLRGHSAQLHNALHCITPDSSKALTSSSTAATSLMSPINPDSIPVFLPEARLRLLSSIPNDPVFPSGYAYGHVPYSVSECRKMRQDRQIRRLDDAVWRVCRFVYRYLLSSLNSAPTSQTLRLHEKHFTRPSYRTIHPQFIAVAPPITVYNIQQVKRQFKVPRFSEVFQFMRRIVFKAALSCECVIISLIYIEKVMCTADVMLKEYNWRPIVISCLLLASKLWEDLSSWNIEFSEICPDFPLRGINKLERTLCNLLDFLLHVEGELYVKYYFSLKALGAPPWVKHEQQEQQQQTAAVAAYTGDAMPVLAKGSVPSVVEAGASSDASASCVVEAGITIQGVGTICEETVATSCFAGDSLLPSDVKKASALEYDAVKSTEKAAEKPKPRNYSQCYRRPRKLCEPMRSYKHSAFAGNAVPVENTPKHVLHTRTSIESDTQMLDEASELPTSLLGAGSSPVCPLPPSNLRSKDNFRTKFVLNRLCSVSVVDNTRVAPNLEGHRLTSSSRVPFVEQSGLTMPCVGERRFEWPKVRSNTSTNELSTPHPSALQVPNRRSTFHIDSFSSLFGKWNILGLKQPPTVPSQQTTINEGLDEDMLDSAVVNGVGGSPARKPTFDPDVKLLNETLLPIRTSTSGYPILSVQDGERQLHGVYRIPNK